MSYRNRALLDLAYQLDCQAQIPGICAGGAGEPMHSNQQRHGIGTSVKSADVYFGSGCRACHQAIDHGHPSLSGEARKLYWQFAFERTLLLLWTYGLVTVAREADRSEHRRDKLKRSKGRTARPEKVIPRVAA